VTDLEWNERLATGLELIDEQHKTLFAISNDLLAAIGRNEGEAALADIFNRLKEYTRYHFKAEEALMAEMDYPHRSRHAEEHALLLARVDALWRLISNGETISARNVSFFLSDWIVSHIMEKDGAIGGYANSRP